MTDTINNSEFNRGVKIAVKTIREQIARYSLEAILEALEQTADSREEKRNDKRKRSISNLY